MVNAVGVANQGSRRPDDAHLGSRSHLFRAALGRWTDSGGILRKLCETGRHDSIDKVVPPVCAGRHSPKHGSMGAVERRIHTMRAQMRRRLAHKLQRTVGLELHLGKRRFPVGGTACCLAVEPFPQSAAVEHCIASVRLPSWEKLRMKTRVRSHSRRTLWHSNQRQASTGPSFPAKLGPGIWAVGLILR